MAWEQLAGTGGQNRQQTTKTTEAPGELLQLELAKLVVVAAEAEALGSREARGGRRRALSRWTKDGSRQTTR